jgi:hypothetical protein
MSGMDQRRLLRLVKTPSLATETIIAVKSIPSIYRLFPLYFWLLSLANLALMLLAFSLFSSGSDAPPRSAIANLEVTSAILRPTEAGEDPDLDALNAYGQSIARAGLKNCAVAMNDLTQRLIAGKKVGIYRFPVAHENFVSLSMEVSTDSGAILYLTFNLSQGPGGSCQIAYEAVSDWANSCKEVVETVFKDFVPSRNLLKSVALLKHKDNQGRKVFTMPVQNGCIAIEKEILSTIN